MRLAEKIYVASLLTAIITTQTSVAEVIGGQPETETAPSMLECKKLSGVVDETLKEIEKGTITPVGNQMANLQKAQDLIKEGRYCDARPYILGLKGVH